MTFKFDREFLKQWHEQILKDRLHRRALTLSDRSTKWLQEELMIEIDNAEFIDYDYVNAIKLQLKSRGLNDSKNGIKYSSIEPESCGTIDLTGKTLQD